MMDNEFAVMEHNRQQHSTIIIIIVVADNIFAIVIFIMYTLNDPMIRYSADTIITRLLQQMITPSILPTLSFFLPSVLKQGWLGEVPLLLPLTTLVLTQNSKRILSESQYTFHTYQ